MQNKKYSLAKFCEGEGVKDGQELKVKLEVCANDDGSTFTQFRMTLVDEEGGERDVIFDTEDWDQD